MTVQTDLLLNARSRGFEQANQNIANLGRSSKKAMVESQQEVARLEGSLRRLASEQVRLNRALEATDRGTKAYRTLTEELRGVQRQAAQTTTTITALERAYQEAGQRRGAFTQGLLQGAVPGAAFIQRGPGAMRQAAGVGVGRALRGVAGGMAQTPFTGASGLAQALQSIPGGGFLAMPLMTAMGQAQQALGFRQTQMQQAPFLGGMGMQVAQARARRGAGARAAEAAQLAAFERPVSAADIRERVGGGVAAEARRRGVEVSTGSPMDMLRNMVSMPGTTAARQTQARNIQAELARDGENRAKAEFDIRNERATKAFRKEMEKTRNQAAAGVRRRFLGDITGTGVDFGFAPSEALGVAGAISAAGGGTGREMARQGLLRPAMAAQRFLGVGPDVAGAFLQGGRRGGVVGGRGRAGEAFEEALRDGLRMGLQGSELQEHMAAMAADIRSWRNTGIPINTGSISEMGRTIGQMGVGGLRGAVMARGLGARARDLSTRGPQTAAEFAMFQELGGFKGGGAQDVEEAQLKLEEGNLTGDDMRRLFSRFMGAGGGGAPGRAVFRRAMRGLGINVGIRESRILEKQVRGGRLDPGEMDLMSQIERERAGGEAAAGAFQPDRLARALDPAIRRQASIARRQVESGQVMIKVMQDLESSTTAMAKGFTTLAGEPLQALTSGVEDLATAIPKATERLNDFLSGDIFGAVFSGGGG